MTNINSANPSGLRAWRMLRAVIGLLTLLAWLLGPPWLLAVTIGWPLPDHLPTIEELLRWYNYTSSTTAITHGLAVAGWVTWAIVTLSGLRGIADAIKQTIRGYRHNGLWHKPQHRSLIRAAGATLAGMIIAGIISSTARAAAPPSTATGGAEQRPTSVTATATARDEISANVIPFRSRATTTTVGNEKVCTPETYVVRPDDNLSIISQKKTGSQRGWPWIYRHSKSIRQPDGAKLTNPNRIRPGWKLRVLRCFTPTAPATTTPRPHLQSPDRSRQTGGPDRTTPSSDTGSPGSPSRTTQRSTAPTSPTGSNHTNRRPPRTQAPHTQVPQADPPPASQPEPSDAGDGSLPGGGWMPPAAVAALAALVALAIQRRRRLRDFHEPTTPVQEPQTPAVRFLMRVRPRPQSQVRTDRLPWARQPSGTTVTLIDLPTPLVLVGPGANSAIRAAIATSLAEPPVDTKTLQELDGNIATTTTSIKQDEPHLANVITVPPPRHVDRTALVITAPDLTRLVTTTTDSWATSAPELSPGSHHLGHANVHLTHDLSELCAILEGEVITRRRATITQALAGPAASRPNFPPILAIATPEPEFSSRLNAILDAGADLNIRALMRHLPVGFRAAKVEVNSDGILGVAASRTQQQDPAAASTTGSFLQVAAALDGARASILTADQLRELITLAIASPTANDSDSPPAHTTQATAGETRLSDGVSPSDTHATDSRTGDTRRIPPTQDPQRHPTGQDHDAQSKGTARSAQPPQARPSASPQDPETAATKAGSSPTSYVGSLAPKDKQIRLDIVGPARVTTAGNHITRGWGERGVELLAFLAVRRQGASLGEIASELWPSEPRSSVSNRLSSLLGDIRRNLRQATGMASIKGKGAFILFDGRRYHLDANIFDVDLWQIQDLMTELHARPDDTTAMKTLLNLYRGPLDAGTRPGPWADDAGYEINAAIGQVAGRYAESQLNNDIDNATTILTQACRIDRHNESLHCLLMRAHATAGRPADVAATYRRLQQVLDELDVQPQPATTKLAQTLTNFIPTPPSQMSRVTTAVARP